MSIQLQQAGRIASITTPLGENVLVLTGFDGVEGLSELYEFRVDALSEKSDVDFNQILGRNCCISMTLFDAPERHFCGVAVEAQATGMRQDLYTYRLVLRPSLWFLTRTTNCRIFHEKTALDIVKEVLSSGGVEVNQLTQRDYATLDYCVQYRESDFAFVSRLMEQHGIYYYFKHTGEGCTMVLADASSSHEPVEGTPTVDYTSATAALQAGKQSLMSWSSERRFRSGKIELRDYNYVKPASDLTCKMQGSESYNKATQFEIYDYPGKHAEKEHGNNYARVRLDAEQAVDHRRFAGGEAVNLYPGGFVTVQKHPIETENKQYLVVRCTHHFADEAFRSVGGAAILERPYHGNFELALADRPFRAPLVTPKPLVYGPQTAKVVAREKSKDSEEIDVDDDGYGLIKVRFHWDRDDKRSCWLRVAQMWAGHGWGGQFIPRIGMEVVIEFLEGDPDRPLVVGAVYNGSNPFPYSLPDNKTQSGVKSDSSKGHGGYNEFMFEDKKDSESIRMHAQKDHEVVILNKETTKIGEKFSDGGASRETTLLHGDDTLTISTGKQTVEISTGSQSTSVMEDIKIESKTANITLVTGATSIKLTPSSLEISSPQITIKADATLTLKGGVISIN